MILVVMALLLLQEQTAEQLVNMLSSDKVEEREAAGRRLTDLGRNAFPHLRKGAQNADPEVARRCNAILGDIALFLGDEEQQKIRKALSDAKALRVKFHFEETFGTKKSVTDGVVLFKGQDKVHLSGTRVEMGTASQFLLVSDGVILRAQFDLAGEVEQKPVPKEIRKQLVDALLLLGGDYSFTVLWVEASKGARDLKTEITLNDLSVSKYVAGEDEDGLRTLCYKLNIEGKDFQSEARLWYDPKTCLPRRRQLKLQRGSENLGVQTEDYSEFVVDPELPDKMFALAAPDPARRAAISKARAQLAKLKNALSMFEVDTGSYPTSEQGLKALIQKPPGVEDWKGPYVEGKEIPRDPWGNPFRYSFPVERSPLGYKVSSVGPDGKAGTADDLEK
jgi:general secretion pathway protein G